jgi:hypothetical protein
MRGNINENPNPQKKDAARKNKGVGFSMNTSTTDRASGEWIIAV